MKCKNLFLVFAVALIASPSVAPSATRREGVRQGGKRVQRDKRKTSRLSPARQWPQWQTCKFDVITLDESLNVKNERKERARCFVERLGGGITLEMVEIPGGTFLMGSPEGEAERYESEGPQHRVSVPTFYMSRFEVTQAQWRAVAKLPKVRIDLNPYPSYFKGDNRPVEQVLWHEAEEFCERLTRWARLMAHSYRLPSEAEWEYACRARTTTPFAFGETITTDLVNYNRNYPYGRAPKGTNPDQTAPVRSFGVANAFGLYDMHGNVWEWCMDGWHDNYEGAPIDGSAWKGGYAGHVLRGGAFGYKAREARSASRRNINGLVTNTIGFRVVLPAP